MELQFVDDEISAWGGVAVLKKMLDRLRFEEVLQSLPLPAQLSNRAYAPEQLLIQFMTSVWCGANRYAHLDVSRFDTTLQKLFGWQRMPEHKAFQRYFNKFDLPTTHAVFSGLYKWFFTNLNFDNYTLDIDSSVVTRYGEQQGAAKGYNKHKPGRKSHHPIMAFVSEIEMIANFWLRSGDAHTANNFKAFLEETLCFLEHKKIGLLRMDSGFYDKKIFNYLEGKDGGRVIDYIIAVPMYVSIQRKIATQKVWQKVDDAIEIVDFQYQAQDWEEPRRMVCVRQKISERPNSVVKQLSIFEEHVDINGYRYSCYITTLKFAAADVWRLYRGRANCENRIKELKYDYGLDKMNQASFDGTEASLLMLTIAYNLMSLFKQVCIGEKIRQRLSTLRHKLLAIPSMIQNSTNKLIVSMALNMNRRVWIQKLWNNTQHFEWKTL